MVKRWRVLNMLPPGGRPDLYWPGLKVKKRPLRAKKYRSKSGRRIAYRWYVLKEGEK